MSRFVEGSMSDRASAVPPVAFLGAADRHGGRSRGLATTAASAAAAPALFARRSMQAIRPAAASFPWMDASTNTSATSSTAAPAATEAPAPRRPRSFLAPLWDGVTRHLHWRTRSNADLEGEQPQVQQQQQQAQQKTAPFRAQGQQPSADEILANYHQLVEAGFFSQRAIPATRQGLTRSAPPIGRPSAAAKGACPPLPTAPAAATMARGMKRGHADDDDDDENNDEGEGSHAYVPRRHHADADATPDTAVYSGEGRRSLRARGQQPRKLRKPSVSRAGGGGRDRPLPAGPRPVDVHQALPRASQRLAQRAAETAAAAAAAAPAPAPAPVPALVPAGGGRRTLSKKRKSSTSAGHSTRSREQMRAEDRHGADSHDDDDGDDSHAAKKKKRSTAHAAAVPVVVHHAPRVPETQQQQQQQQQKQEWRLEQTLRPRPGPSQEDARPAAHAMDVEPAPRPISFHYPQRVRVRRPLQDATQGVRLRAQGPGPRRAQAAISSSSKATRQGGQDRRDSLELLPKPRTAAMLEDEENAVPLW